MLTIGIVILGFILLSIFLTKKDKKPGETWQGAELRQMEEQTDKLNKEMSNPVNWILLIIAVGGAFFTYGITLILLPFCFHKMGGDAKALVQAATPKTVDVIAPKAAVIRMGSGCIGILIWCFMAVVLVSAILVYMGCTINVTLIC